MDIQMIQLIINSIQTQKYHFRMKRNRNTRKFILLLLISTFLLVNSQDPQESQPVNPVFEYLQQFQQTMESMFPTQAFGFDINQGEVETITLWPQSDTDEVIITYYIQNQENPELVTGKGFFSQCYVNSNVFRTFLNQKVGICKIKLTERPSNIELKFKSEVPSLMTVYIQYEEKKLQIQTRSILEPSSNVPTQQEESKKKLSSVSKTFEKVQLNSENQQTMLRNVLKGMSKHSKRLQGNIKYTHHRIITQTIIVILSGLLGMWILKKQLNKGYQLLV